MRDWFSQPPAELVRPDYVIHRYTDAIYKVVNFKNPRFRLAPPVREEKAKYDFKLDSSLSRARRVVLELALCNEWAYFCTFTLDKEKYKRDDLPKFHKDMTQYCADLRKKYKKMGYDFPIRFVFVPEEHEKYGAWHMHGLISDITPVLTSFADLRQQGKRVPDNLVKGGFFDWPDYSKKFGFCSLGKIRNKVATAFYVTKYITKQIDDCKLPVGAHAYYPSRGLNRAEKQGDVYGYCNYLHQFLDRDYEFCRTGMTHVKHGLSWDFAFEYIDHGLIEPLDFMSDTFVDDHAEVDTYVEYTQAAIDGFMEVSL